MLAGLGVLAVGGAAYGVHWFQTGRYLQGTDNAYVKADTTTIAPRVSGYIGAVLVGDNESVKAGEVLARIDDRDLKTALAQAQADVASAQNGIANLDAQLSLQQALIDQANADIASSQAAREFAAQDFKRYSDLLKTGYGTVQKAQSASANLRQQTAALDASRAALAAAQQKIQVLKTQRDQAQSALARAQAIEQQAELNLSYATITSPIDGVVGARTLRVGQYVQAGTALLAVVPLQSVYVVANFKETQLAAMRNGEPARFKVDSFPGSTVHGHVDSLAPASGQEFSLLPPDNATGNFTKIVQRVPVKIAINADDPLAGQLRPGMSVEVTVDTKATAVAMKSRPTHTETQSVAQR
ncbi:MAG: HlyD family secretion protein [Alphaproteobacteria bacterium]